jgi:hypothetical protein
VATRWVSIMSKTITESKRKWARAGLTVSILATIYLGLVIEMDYRIYTGRLIVSFPDREHPGRLVCRSVSQTELLVTSTVGLAALSSTVWLWKVLRSNRRA